MSGRGSTPTGTLRQRHLGAGGEATVAGAAANTEQLNCTQKAIYTEKYMCLRMKHFQDVAKAHGVTDHDGNYRGFWSDPFGRRDFCFKELEIALPRVAIALLFFLTGLYVNCVSQAWLQQNLTGYYEKLCPDPFLHLGEEKTLWDITFKFLPRVHSTAPADFFAAVSPTMVIIRFLVLPGPMSLRWTILQRWLMVWGLIWFIRSVTIMVTPLPNPDFTCTALISSPDNIFIEAFFIMTQKDLTCQDVMFSGHTVALTLGMMLITKYSRLAPWTSYVMVRGWFSSHTLLHLSGRIFTLVGYYFIAGSRFHYTLDVLVGALITVAAFNAYHDKIELSWLRKEHGGSDVMDMLLDWLDKYAKDRYMKAQWLTQVASQDRWLDRN